VWLGAHVSGLHVGSWVGSVMPKNLKHYYGHAIYTLRDVFALGAIPRLV